MLAKKCIGLTQRVADSIPDSSDDPTGVAHECKTKDPQRKGQNQAFGCDKAAVGMEGILGALAYCVALLVRRSNIFVCGLQGIESGAFHPEDVSAVWYCMPKARKKA